MGFVGMRVSHLRGHLLSGMHANCRPRIVEYATREQAQNAVATLSNQNLMGRLVYVREASPPWDTNWLLLISDRTARLSHASAPPEELSPAAASAAEWAAEWDLAVPADTAVVGPVSALPWVAWAVPAAAVGRSTSPTFVPSLQRRIEGEGDIDQMQLPYTVGWQDLKDLFRQAGKYSLIHQMWEAC